MTRINLLPPDERAKAAREQGLALVVLGLVALVIVLGGVYLVSYRQASDKQTEVEEIQAEVDQANQQLAALKPYEGVQQSRDEIQTHGRRDLRLARPVVEHPRRDQSRDPRHGLPLTR